MSKNLFAGLKPEARLSKNAFDLSFRNVFSAKAGQILPIMCQELVPGDHFKVDCSALIRTQPLNTAAFLRTKAYYHFFFVPYSTLWHGWDSFINQRENQTSSHVVGSRFVPNIGLRDLDVLLKKHEDDNKDVHGFKALNGSYKLCEYLGYGGLGFSDGTEGSSSEYVVGNPKVSLFPILAYNKIYYDYYSNPYYEEPNPLLFNVDVVNCESPESSDILKYPLYLSDANKWKKFPLLDMFTIKYRSYKKDLFMGLLPDSQFGSVSLLPFSDVNIIAKSRDGSPVSAGTMSVAHEGLVKAEYSGKYTDTFNLSPGIDVLQLRKVEALQRWKENTLRAGNRLSDNAIAHFGVRPRHFMSDHADYIGGFDSSVNVDEVIAQANAANELGQIGGKGISAINGSQIEYDATEFGVLMCMFSIVPESDYNGSMVSKSNTRLEAFDFFTPEYENLGLEPVLNYQLTGINKIPRTRLTGPNRLSLSPVVLGYAPRYSDYKINVDVVHDEFKTGKSLSAWCTPRSDISPYSGISIRLLKVNPSILDTVFVKKMDDKVSSDPFLINSYFNVSALRPMSILGLPNF